MRVKHLAMGKINRLKRSDAIPNLEEQLITEVHLAILRDSCGCLFEVVADNLSLMARRGPF